MKVQDFVLYLAPKVMLMENQILTFTASMISKNEKCSTGNEHSFSFLNLKKKSIKPLILHTFLLFINSRDMLLEAFRSSLKLLSGVPLVTLAGGMH